MAFSCNRYTGYTVIAIPEEGLFIKDGKLVSGSGEPIICSQISLYNRQIDALESAERNADYWKFKAKSNWNFITLPVAVNERTKC